MIPFDPTALLKEAWQELPAFVEWVRGKHPELDLTPLGDGADAMDAARAAAMKRTGD